ncbi:SidA/IucD/PvdA family monooxygenase [Escherichia coli]|nr:SidA/IucD/PvdA family monooxygenase [Escherichia coli]MCV1170429.1 lysine N(6)-hydroxylase/L-ornithine N(5)-oxygenase family protein [Escherichia coli]
MKKSVDFIGVGTGPFNLSIAALSHQIEELDCLFFDEHPHFSWHPGMLVPDCHSGTLPKLITPVQPLNRSLSNIALTLRLVIRHRMSDAIATT